MPTELCEKETRQWSEVIRQPEENQPELRISMQPSAFLLPLPPLPIQVLLIPYVHLLPIFLMRNP